MKLEDSFQTPSVHRGHWAVLLFGVLVVTTILVVASIPFFWFDGFVGKSITRNPGDWSLYGDFVGGLATPVLCGAALILVFVLLRSQRDELTATLKALEDSHQTQLHQAQIARHAAIIYAEAAKIHSIASQRSQLLDSHQQGMDGYTTLGAIQDELSRLEQIENVALANLTGLSIDLGHVRDPEPSHH